VKKKKAAVLFLSLFLLSGRALASGNELSEVYAKHGSVNVVKKEFTRVFPKMWGKIKSIKRINADEIYEIVLTNDLILYYLRTADGQKKFIMFGSLFDTRGNNLTAARKNEILNAHADEYYNLVKKHVSNAVKIGNGKEAIFYVFIDPDCPHCRRIFRYLSSNRDRFTSYFFVMNLSSWTKDKAKFAVCSLKNRAERLIDVMDGTYDSYTPDKMEELLNEKCTKEELEDASRILRENRELAEKVRLTGTPHIIMKAKDEKARIIRGANINLIEKFLKEKAK